MFNEAPVKIEFTEKTPDGVASQLESLTDVQAYDALSNPRLLERTSNSQSIGFVPAAQAAQAIIPVITKAIRAGKSRKDVIMLAELHLHERYRFTDEGRAAIGEMVDAAYSVNAKPTPRPATTLTPDNPTVTIQPDGGASRPTAGVANPVLDGTYISSRTGQPYETAEAAQNGLVAGRLEATHEVSAIDGGYGLVPKRSNTPPATPIQATAGTITTVGEGGLNVMHGSTRADLTADQIQVINPNSKQGKRGRVYGGFYATTDAASAQRYANMGKEGSVPTVYDVQIKAGSNILDSAGDITRLSESTIAQHRTNKVDVVRGKDPRGQVEYAIINPEAVGALKPRAKPAAAKTTQGRAFTTDNTPVDFVYDVVPIEAIQKSLNADMTQNRAARSELQPRDRDTADSVIQINDITNKLNPNRLLESPTFDTGAPTIVGAEAVAGHGRLTAIERRYLSGSNAEYKAAVTAKARELGIDPVKFEGIENPVLVRRLSDDATAVKVASDSNDRTTLAMSPAEQARVDAKALPDTSKLVIDDDGVVNIAGSTDFVRGFIHTLNPAERGGLSMPDGTLSQAGVRRIQAAIAEKAYTDGTMLERMVAATDDNTKRVSGALIACCCSPAAC